MLLYFLDEHAYPPEPPGMWVSGAGRADIIVPTDDPIHYLAFTAVSPVRTILTISAGAGTSTIPLVPGESVTFQLPVSGVSVSTLFDGAPVTEIEGGTV